ncbi:MAG: imidazolonepropionase [Acidobacteriota bacterium]
MGVTWDLLLRRARIATLAEDQEPGQVGAELGDGALAVAGGHIAWLGQEDQLPAEAAAEREIDCEGAWLTPGLIDCHTHLVYAGNRSHELERRLEGVSYQQIAREGGGIRSTVRSTRAANVEALVAASTPRLTCMRSEGLTTVEIKSGYGLELPSERRMLRAARWLAETHDVSVRTSFLGAHAVPEDFDGRADAYIDHLIADVLPVLAEEGLVDAVDGFCETIAFTPQQIERVFQAAHQLELPVKLHAEQLSDQGGAELVARHRGLSADHLEYLSQAGVDAMAAAGTVAVLLPGAFYFLRETQVPPILALREAGVPIAIATDCNPGSSPLTSPLLAMNLACVCFGLTPSEALAGMTREAARALGVEDRGVLAPGKRADLALWRIDRPAELAYGMGHNPLELRVFQGLLDGPMVNRQRAVETDLDPVLSPRHA